MRAGRRGARVGWTVAAVAMAAAGCSGPKAPFAVRVKELPSDVVLKAKADRSGRAAAAALPPLALPLTVPGVERLSAFTTSGDIAAPVAPRPAPKSACPAADPRQAPALEAVNSPRLPPVPARYAFRNEGTFEVTGANAKKGLLPGEGEREIRNVVDLSTTVQTVYGFEVASTLGPLSTTVGYSLVTESDSPLARRAGLYMTRMQSRSADGSEFRFTPRSGGMLMLPFPAAPGTTWDAADVDPATQTALSYRGSVGQKTRVDACGVLLDAISVRLDGSLGDPEDPQAGGGVSPAGADRFEASYEFGTQFGALALRETVVLDRAQPDSALHQVNKTTINSSPAPAALPKEGGQ